MTVTAYPFTGQPTTEGQYGALFGQLQDDGLVGVPGDLDGRVLAATGLQLSVGSFALAYLAGTAVVSDSPVNVTLTAAAAADRVDRVVVRVRADNTVEVGTITGTAGSGAPAFTRSLGGIYELPLARVTVPANATTLTAANIVDERAWVSGRVGKWSTATRPGTAGQRPARQGDLGWNSTSKTWEGWNGTGWTAVGGGGGTPVYVWNGSAYVAATSVYIGSATPPATADGSAWIA